ncbi:hypothetical protein PSTT_17044 [Puccinia striiformis]|uniref:Uncharacterized protein n=1 Tax=Puccinia striiformis TaxID=27350 RepID=A0A2S4UA27_9BASI|nr:hypothetical protein PSTT_17044 [Puccinia striiformis]
MGEKTLALKYAQRWEVTYVTISERIFRNITTSRYWITRYRYPVGGGSSQIASLLGGDRQSDAMKYWVPSPIAQQSSINPVEAPSEPTSQQVACSGGRGRGIAPGDDARWLSLDTL